MPRTRLLLFSLSAAWLALVLLGGGLAVPALAGEGAPTATASIPSGRDFGAVLTLADLSPLEDVVAHPEKYADRDVLVRGRISDVCQKRGCWVVLSEGDSHVRISFKDYGFFVPKDCSGSQAYVEGRVRVETLSEEQARHYESESRDGDPSKVHGEQRVVSFTASGLRLLSR
jgi:hypothetical protein